MKTTTSEKEKTKTKNISKLNDKELEKVAGGALSQEEALARALEHVQIRRDQIDFLKKVELDYEHGRQVYEIKFYQGGMEYEFDVDAESGSILRFEKDFD